MIDKEKKDKSIVESVIIQEKVPVVVVVPELKQPKKKAKKPLTKKDTRKEDLDLGDVVLERCVSYFRGLHFTSALEFLDITLPSLRLRFLRV